MPNHVTHKIIFAAERAAEVFDAVLDSDGRFAFGRLVPQPPEIYTGCVTSEDQADFKCGWYSWNVEHWGTKGDAYATEHGIDDKGAWIKFDTAWSVPYPILSAFNNRFQMPFEHRYYDEYSNFWGIETWGTESYGPEPKRIVRTKKRRDNQSDRRALCMELKGYDPDDEQA